MARAYLGLPWLISVILAIIPFTNVLLGIITRLTRGNIIGVLLNIFLAPIFYILDLITIIANQDVTVLA
jgi:hypothetical protein